MQKADQSSYYSHSYLNFIKENNYLITKNENIVIYSNKDLSLIVKTISSLGFQNAKLSIQKCFDDLLSIFEKDWADIIIFDNDLTGNEVKYISRWAKIFKPSMHIISNVNFTVY